MALYNGLLSAAVEDIRQKYAATQVGGLLDRFDKNFKLTAASETPKAAADFELVTWLVIMGDDKG